MVSTGHGLLVYDGECGFCTSAARWVERRWPPGQGHRTISAQRWDNARASGVHLTPDELRRSAWWIQGDRRDEGARAVARALIGVGGTWAFLGWVCLTPPISHAAARVYRLVARYRAHLPGATAECDN